MKVLYSGGRFREVEIAGNRHDWQAFAAALQKDGSRIACPRVDNPAPYEKSLICISIVHQAGRKAEIATGAGDELTVVGDPGLLEVLSQTARTFARDFREGQHIHIEYQGEDHFVALESVPTVFSYEG
jgi:hypothetical protein